ncbi:MAG: septum formation initiator family protein [Synergistaceae bacterium]
MALPKIRFIIYIAVISFVCAVLLTSFSKEVKKIENLSVLLDKKMEELVEEKRKSIELEEKIDYYSSPEGIARLAREKFNLVKSGEIIYEIKVVSKDILP